MRRWEFIERGPVSQRRPNVLPAMRAFAGVMMAFRQGLMELGWIEGRNIDIEFRWPGGDIERAQTFAKELVGLRPDVLLARSTPAVDALKKRPARFRSSW